MLQNRNNKIIKDLLSLEFGEIKMLALLFSCDFIRRLASLLLETAGSSIFLYEFDSDGLPYVFMLTGILTICTACHFIRIKKLPNIVAGITLMGMALVTLMLYLLYAAEYTTIAAWGLMIWKNVGVLLSEVVFLLIALKFCKYDWHSWRFSAILMMEATALITSGLGVTVLVYFVTPISLVFISSVLLFIAGFMLYKLTLKMDNAPSQEKTYTVETARHSPLQLGLVTSFFTMMALFMVGSYLIEYLFYKGVFHLYGAWLADMTAFFALYHVFVGMLVFITVAAFRQYEGIRSLKFTPITLSLFMFLAAAGCVVGSVWILTFSRMVKNVLYKMLMTPTAKFFAVPLLPSLAKQLSKVRRIFIEPGSIVVAGIILLYLETYNMNNTIIPILIFIGFAIAVLAYLSYRLYTKVTFDSLNNRYWWGGSLFLEDAKLKEFVRSEIMTPDVASSIYFLRAIELSQSKDIEEYFFYALNHESYRVRLFAISRLERMHAEAALPLFAKLITSDTSLEVQNLALQAYCVIGGDSVIKEVIAYTKENPKLVKGASIGFLKSGGEGAFLAAGHIGDMLKDANKAAKIAVAEILGAAKSETYYLPLVALLKDKNIDVRRAAIIAAGRIHTPKLAIELVDALDTAELREDAAESILRLGQGALPALTGALQDKNKTALESRIINLIWRIGGKEAMHILADVLKSAVTASRLRILNVLATKDWTLLPQEMENFVAVLTQEQERKHWLSACIKDMANAKNHLKDGEKTALEILLAALKNEQEQSSEIIDIAYDIVHKYGDFSLVLAANKKLKFNKNHYMDYAERLGDIITFAPANLHTWTTSAALYLAGFSKNTEFVPMIMDALNNKNCLIKETALWALNNLLPKNRSKEIAGKYIKDSCKNVAALAKFILN